VSSPRANDLVHHRGMPDAFAEHLAEAVRSLGYFELSAIPALVDLYRQRWEGGTSSSILRREEIAPLLSAKGASDPRHAQMATYSRAIFNLWREEDDARERVWLRMGEEVRFTARAKWLCEEARSQDGTVRPIKERWSIPLSGCGQEWCPCRWHLVYERRSKG